jgi:hypothetical protein
MEENYSPKSGYTKKSIWSWLAIYLVVAVVLYGGYYYFIQAKNNGYAPVTSPVADVSTPVPQKFQDSPLAAFAFQVYPGPLSEPAKQATSSFKISTQTQGDGSILVGLTSSNPNYLNQQVIVQPGYTLYFIEKNSTDDDTTANTDRTTNDDTTVLVDPQGFIVR